MSRLDFSSHPLAIHRATHPRLQTSLSVGFSAEERGELAAALAELADQPSAELKLELPEGWTIYWKLRDGESRLLLAHPEPDLWVATLALSNEHLQAVSASLRTDSPGSVGEWNPISRMSNVEFAWEARS